MKKIAALLAACLMVLSVFAACAKKEDTPDVQPDQSVTQTEIENDVTLVNPMVESDADGIMNDLGFGFNDISGSEGVENVRYYIIDGKLADMQFDYGSVKLDARMQSAAEFTDISGMYYTWTSEEECEISGRPGKTMVYFEEGAENVQVCLWYDVVPGIMYSVSAVAEDLDGFDVTAFAEQVYAPMQGEVDGD